MKHLTEDELLLYIEGNLSEEKIAHIKECELCKNELKKEEIFLSCLVENFSKRNFCLSIEKLSKLKDAELSDFEKKHLEYCPFCQIEVEILDEINKPELPNFSLISKIFPKKLESRELYFEKGKKHIILKKGLYEVSIKEKKLKIRVENDTITFILEPPPPPPLVIFLHSEKIQKKVILEKESLTIPKGQWSYVII